MHTRFRVAAAVLAIVFSQAAVAESPLQESLRQLIPQPVAEKPAADVVILLHLNPREGATQEAADARVQELVSFLGKQAGYLDGQFLRNINPANDPRYVHVTRWKSFDDWERLFTSPDFATEVDRQSPFISAEGSAFVRVPLR